LKLNRRSLPCCRRDRPCGSRPRRPKADRRWDSDSDQSVVESGIPILLDRVSLTANPSRQSSSSSGASTRATRHPMEPYARIVCTERGLSNRVMPSTIRIPWMLRTPS